MFTFGSNHFYVSSDKSGQTYDGQKYNGYDTLVFKDIYLCKPSDGKKAWLWEDAKVDSVYHHFGPQIISQGLRIEPGNFLPRPSC